MSTKMIDPTVASVAGLTAGTGGGNGGGLAMAAGTYYSKASKLDPAVAVSITDVFDWTGTLSGTLTPEISNATEDDVRNGTDKWATYAAGGSITLTGAAGTDYSEQLSIGFEWFRWKVVVTAGAGTLLDQRSIKKAG